VGENVLPELKGRGESGKSFLRRGRGKEKESHEDFSRLGEGIGGLSL